MKTYNTYQEAKIANPECEIAVVARTDEFTPSLGYFISVLRRGEGLDGYSFADKSKSGSPNIGDGYYKICNPSDYCVTVEGFLRAGYKLEVGDLYLTSDGRVENVHNEEFKSIMNEPCDDKLDSKRYILRAAALEKPKCTRVEFVKVEDSIWHLETDFKCGELFAFDGSRDYVQIETECDFTLSHSSDNLYRRTETEIDERQEFIDAACVVIESHHGERRQYVVEALYDSGKFKLVN